MKYGRIPERATAEDVDGDRGTRRERSALTAENLQVLGHPERPDDLHDERRQADETRDRADREVRAELVGELAAA